MFREMTALEQVACRREPHFKDTVKTVRALSFAAHDGFWLADSAIAPNDIDRTDYTVERQTCSEVLEYISAHAGLVLPSFWGAREVISLILHMGDIARSVDGVELLPADQALDALRDAEYTLGRMSQEIVANYERFCEMVGVVAAACDDAAIREHMSIVFATDDPRSLLDATRRALVEYDSVGISWQLVFTIMHTTVQMMHTALQQLRLERFYS